jgi:hypothetical protein
MRRFTRVSLGSMGAVEKTQGMLAANAGDAMTALWGPAFERPDHAEARCELAERQLSARRVPLGARSDDGDRPRQRFREPDVRILAMAN